MKVESEIVIYANAGEVWSVISDVAHWADWLPTISSVQPLTESSIAPERRYRVTQPKLLPAVYEVKVVEPGRRFAWESKQPGVRTFADHEILPAEGSAVKVRLSVNVTGVLGTILGFLMAPLTRSYLRQECISLKSLVEAAN